MCLLRLCACAADGHRDHDAHRYVLLGRYISDEQLEKLRALR